MDPASDERLTLLDPLRILASVAVVRNHMRGDYLLGVGFGLFLFLVIMLALASSGRRSESLAGFGKRKARFLLAPWLRWSVLYLALAFIGGVLGGRGLPDLNAALLITGGHRSLWFLPFAVVAVIIAKALQLLLRRVRAEVLVVPACAAAILCSLVADRTLATAGIEFPLRAWVQASPAVGWGLALGFARRLDRGQTRRTALLLIALAATIAFLYSPYRDFANDLGRRFAVAVTLASIGFAFRPRITPWVRFVGTLTFGVYLVHPMIGKILGRCFQTEAWDAGPLVALVWVLAAGVVYGMRRAALGWQECVGPDSLRSR